MLWSRRGTLTRSSAGRLVLVAGTLLTLPGLAGAAAGTGAFGATLAVASDYVLRGVSQSQGGAAVQGGLELSGASGWRAGAWASNVDFTGAGDPADGADLEVDLYLAHGIEFGERLSLDTTLISYAYPGTAPGVDYSYGELIVALHVRELICATVYYSNDAFATHETGVAYELASRRALRGDVELAALYGHYDLDRALGGSYSYYSVGLSKDLGDLTLGLRYEGTDPAGSRLWGALAEDRFVVAISAQM